MRKPKAAAVDLGGGLLLQSMFVPALAPNLLGFRVYPIRR